MQEHCRTQRALRPGDTDGADPTDGTAVRFFLCGRCRTHVLICSHCDRGQVYCAAGCAGEARRSAQREAGRRYQASRNGRFAHAERNRRYRARRQNVTHQGSPAPPTDDLLPAGPAEAVSGPRVQSDAPGVSAWHCHWCNRRCRQFVRQDFIRRRPARSIGQHDRRGSARDHPS